jgi:hypothetical protein
VLFLLVFSVSAFAQTPQYYNFSGGTGYNTIPFTTATGRGINNLYLAGEFIQPTPIPPGKRITAIYFNTATAGTRTYTNFQILLKQDTTTTLTAGVWHPGPYDTVFVGDTSFTITVGGWMKFTLKNKFNYDPTKSLIMIIGQCGTTGTGGGVYVSGGTGIRRVTSVGGCPFVVGTGGDATRYSIGFDVESVTGVTPIVSNIPDKYSLAQNYPNPFNPNTIIRFQIKDSRFVTLKVFDELGREIKSLVNEKLNAGEYETTFDGSNLPSGVYFYKLTAGNFSEVKRMMLIK